MAERRVLLAQLPIPPAGPERIVGNVPLAAGYLILHARLQGLEQNFDFQILPTEIANYAADAAIVAEIVSRKPWMVGFSCYLWNIDRTLWIAAQLKQHAPELVIIIGGPEVTADNAWVLSAGVIDYAVIGEGEQTFTELLAMWQACGGDDGRMIAGLWRASAPQWPLFRKPLANLDVVSSPYLAGILDVASEGMLLLETIRGCVFKCKFCYYPKSYDALYFVSREKVVANLRLARQAGAREVVLLDPTLNQRRDFDDFLRLLAEENPDQQFTYFGELRAEGIKPETARLLRAANFTEVEIGLQSIDPSAQALMDRRNNLKAFERGVAAMLDAGIRVKVDLIIGLPGDTVSSVRRGFDYLAESKLFTSMQVFNLAILPGTAFRQEAQQLGLSHQARPPYYVLETPTLTTADLYSLMADAQEIFDTNWDPFPEPKLEFEPGAAWCEVLRIDLEQSTQPELPPASARAQALTLWFSAREFSSHASRMQQLIRQVLDDNPHSTLQIILEPQLPVDWSPLTIESGELPSEIELPTSELLDQLLSEAYAQPNYLDRYYSLNPQGMLGSKRVIIKLADEIYASDEWPEAFVS